MNPPRGGIPGPGAGPGALVEANEGDGADTAAEGATQERELLISDAIRRRRGLLEWSRACRAAAEGRLAAAGRSSGAVGATPANPDDEARAFRSMAAEAEGAWTTRATRGGRVDYGAMLRGRSGDDGDEEFETGDRSAAEDLSDDAGTCSSDDDQSESSESEDEYHDGSRKRRRYCFSKRARKNGIQWEQRIQELAQFKREHGHCNVKQRSSRNNALAAFVKKMREYKKRIDRGESKGTRILTPRRIMHLELMGFVWNVRPDWGRNTFDGHLKNLQSFKDRHGHCDVPRVLEEDMALARWCHTMRQSYKAIGRGEKPAYKLSKEQIERLVAMGFRLKVKERGKITMKSFEQRIEDLKAYKRAHGHLRVMPMMDRGLSAFCSQLRGARRHPDRTNAMKLTDARIAALDSIGFLWEVNCRVPVRQRIQELKEYKGQHWEFPVYSMNQSLATFCRDLRRARREPETSKMKLNDGDIAELDLLGFDWNPPTFSFGCTNIDSRKRISKQVACGECEGCKREACEECGACNASPKKRCVLRICSNKPQINANENARVCPSFADRIEALRAYKEKHGHLRVKISEDKSLYHFCGNIRNARNKPETSALKLNADRVKALDALEFDWAPSRQRKTFEERLDQLKKYKNKHGTADVTYANDNGLAQFCYAVRCSRNSPETSALKLNADQVKALDALEFDWAPSRQVKTFAERLDQLKEYKNKHGHLAVGIHHNKSLANFCTRIRGARRNKGYLKLTDDQVNSLNEIGFLWELGKKSGDKGSSKRNAVRPRTPRKSFSDRLKELRAFKEEHGHLAFGMPNNKSLANFCSKIRGARKNVGSLKLTDDQVNSLNEIGFLWEPGKSSKRHASAKSFAERVEDLKKFQMMHGHLEIKPKDNASLAKFCTNVRHARKNPGGRKKLTEEQISSLDAIGFQWAVRKSFSERLGELGAFKKAHGHLVITQQHNRSLANFCAKIRAARKNVGSLKLTDDQVTSLNEIGFTWEPGNLRSAWNNPGAGMKRKEEQISSPDGIGFQWAVKKVPESFPKRTVEGRLKTFSEWLVHLRAFKENHGHLEVNPNENASLADFCSKVRYARNNPDRGVIMLTSERISLLDSIGFSWGEMHKEKNEDLRQTPEDAKVRQEGNASAQKTRMTNAVDELSWIGSTELQESHFAHQNI